MAQVKGSYAGDVGWNAGAGEHQFFNRRHGAPDRYQSVPLGPAGTKQSPFSTTIGGYATDRHTLFSSIADRRFNRVDGEACKRVDLDVKHQFLRLPGAPSSSFMKSTQMVGGFGGGVRGGGGSGGGGGRVGGLTPRMGGGESGGATPVSGVGAP
jgi:hypothetical protein